MRVCPIAFAAVVSVLLSSAAGGLEVARQAGGEIGPLVVVGDHLYQALGPAILVTNHDAEAPETASLTAPLPGLLTGLAAEAGHLYALVGTGQLAVYSLADPARPALIALEDYSGEPFSSPSALLAAGGRLYLGDGEIGLFTVDISNPADPGFTLASESIASYEQMAIAGGRLLGWGPTAFGRLNVDVFDLTDPDAPAPLGSFDGGFARSRGAADGNFFYAMGFGFEIFDISNPNRPQSVFEDEEVEARTALYSAGRLYFGTEEGLHVWDVSTPAAAHELIVVEAPMGGASQALRATIGADPKAIFATNGGRGLRFALGATPALEHVWELPGGVAPWDLEQVGDHLFSGDTFSGLRTFSAATLESTGRLYEPGAEASVSDFQVVGARAYLVGGGSGLEIADVADPEAPAVIGSLAILNSRAVAVQGSYAYVVGDDLKTIDVADPANPQLETTRPLGVGVDVMSHQGLLLVTESVSVEGGLRIFSLAQPAAPVLLGDYLDCHSAAALDAVGNRVFLACHDGSLHIVDISDPANPTQLAVYEDPDVSGEGLAVAVQGARVFFLRENTVDVVAVADPARPVLESRVQIAFPGRDLELAPGGQVWVAGDNGGIYLLEQNLFASGFEEGDMSAWSGHSP